MNVHCIKSGRWNQNGYIVYNHDSALFIDPGSDSQNFLKFVASHGLNPLAILNTHAHYDHIGAVWDIKTRYSLPFYMHSHDFGLLKHANIYKVVFGEKDDLRIPVVDFDLKDISRLMIGSINLDVYHTPGHTKGGVTFLIDGLLFTGDTLSCRGFGSTTLPGGSVQDLNNTKKKFSSFDKDLMVYPGHGKPFVLGDLDRAFCLMEF